MRLNINLLPEELRAKKTTKLPTWVSFNFFSIPLIALLLCVAIDLVLGILVLWKDADIKMITKRENTLYPQREEQRRLEDKLLAYKKLMRSSSHWGEIMNAISDCLPPTGWFYKFELDSDKGVLLIKGSFYSKTASGGLTKEFISCLNSKKIIEQTFKSINIKQIAQRKIKNTEVKDFYLEFVLRSKGKSKRKRR